MWIDHQQEIAKDGSDILEVDELIERLREWDMLDSEQKNEKVAVRGEMPSD